MDTPASKAFEEEEVLGANVHRLTRLYDVSPCFPLGITDVFVLLVVEYVSE